MKKINIFYIKNEDIKLTISFIKFILKKSNTLIKIRDEKDNINIENIINRTETIKCVFNSKFYDKEELEIIFQVFDINSFYENIDFFVDETYDHVKALSKEPYDQYNEDQIKGILKTNCIWFKYSKPRDIVYFFTKIFFDILTEHKLKNGNKRVATVLLYTLCYYHGFFIKNSLGPDSYKCWENNEAKIIYFAELYHKNHNQEKVKEEIYEWLKDYLYIALNFVE